MVYKFRIISDERRDFARELLINSDQTFLDFHHCLQSDLGYDPDQLSSFFITNSSWEKELQITLIDMMDEGNDSFCTMDQAVLKDHIAEKGDRMLYVFDFFSERSFFIELTEVIGVSESKALPKIVFASGDPPPQIDLALDDLTFSDEDFGDDFSTDSLDDEFGEGFDFPDSEAFDDD
jgi:hypothetical protein